jgi:hypothetical protein
MLYYGEQCVYLHSEGSMKVPDVSQVLIQHPLPVCVQDNLKVISTLLVQFEFCDVHVQRT